MRAVLISFIALIPLLVFSGENQWTSNGPFGGAFTSFTFSPQNSNLIFANSYDGMFRSVDGGRTWSRLDVAEGFDFGPSVRIHPANSGAVVASTESVFFRSTSQGTDWQRVSKLPAEFSDMEFHPTDPQILYGVSYHRGVFKSTNGGTTWTAKNSGLRLDPVDDCCDFPQLEVDPTNGSIIYVLLAARQAFKTTNGGESWQSISQGLRLTDEEHSLKIDPKSPQVLYAGGWEGVFKTTNGGTSWSITNCNCEATGISLDPNKPQVVYSVGGDVYKKSTDSGNTWTRLGLSGALAGQEYYTVAVHPKNSNLVLIGGSGGGLFRSMDAGKTWQIVNTGVDAMPILHVQSHAQRPNDIFAQGMWELYRSRNGGASWDLWPSGHDFFTGDIGIHPKNANLVIVAGAFDSKSIAVSTNGGTNWSFKGPSIQGDYPGADLLALDPIDQNTLYIAPFSEEERKLGIAKSSDLGNTWNFVNTGLLDTFVTAIRIDSNNRSNIFAGVRSGKVFRSTNAGGVWKNTGSGLKSGVAVNSIAVDPLNSSILYAATEAGIYKTTNSGQRWLLKNKGIPVDFDYRYIVIHPSNNQIMFAGGEGGIFITTNAAENWTSFDSNGLELYTANDFQINSSQPDKFLLALNRGVYSYSRSGVPGGPVIEQLAPPAGKIGDSITVNGRNFGPTQGNSKVLFGSADAGTAQSWSDTRTAVRVPSGAKTGPVSVTVASRKSNSFEFTVLPSSGNVEPTTGPSSGGTRVTIIAPSTVSGTQFNVLFGSTLARDVRFTAPNIITCATPPGSGTVDVSVATSVVVTKVGTFTYQ